MNVFKFTLAAAMVTTLLAYPDAATFAAEGIASNLALETPTNVRDCNDLTCFGRLAVREQFAQHTMKEVTMTSDLDCTLVDGVTDGECRVVADPSPDGRAKQKYSECTSLTCFGAIYLRKLFFTARSINAVMLGTDQECGWLNDEFKEKIPCGSSVRVLAAQ